MSYNIMKWRNLLTQNGYAKSYDYPLSDSLEKIFKLKYKENNNLVYRIVMDLDKLMFTECTKNKFIEIENIEREEIKRVFYGEINNGTRDKITGIRTKVNLI